jgi:hypothetical protein
MLLNPAGSQPVFAKGFANNPTALFSLPRRCTFRGSVLIERRDLHPPVVLWTSVNHYHLNPALAIELVSA